ncbi:MAG TPA: type II secretion system secretin GspD [Xanthobacteraceae bacterium]|nr:type II secretion system secretin GspD [Xanthobacteraceae bacterium]
MQTATRSEPATYFNGTGNFIGPDRPPPLTGADQAHGTVTLNLVNVSVPQAAKTILSDVLAVKYTIDPAIKGQVTIQTPNPVTRKEAIDLFQSALRANGAAIIDAGDLYRIVPTELAAVGTGLRLDGGAPPSDQLGSRVQVVQLKYVAAAEIRRILEPIVPRSAIVQTDPARNTITLSGNARELANMLDTIAVFDIDVMKGMSFALVPVQTSQPDVIADDLRTVFASDKEGPMAGMVRFIPNKQLNAVLVVSPQRAYLARAETWVRRFDARAAGTEKQFFTYSVQNRRAQEVADVLQSIFAKETGGNPSAATRNVAPQYREASVQPSTPGFSFSPGGATNMGVANAGISNMGANMSANMGTQNASFPQAPGAGPGFGATTAAQQPAAAAAARPPSPAANTDSGQEPQIRLAVDEGKNAILIQASPADYRRVLRVLGTLDVMPNQVLIEVTIAEVSLNDELKFGLRWFLQHHHSSYSFTDDAGGVVSSVFPGFSYALTLANVSATLNALNQITDVNVVSSPSLTVMDNKTAALQIGDEVPITTQSAVSTLTAGAPIVNSVSYKDTGVILSMTPRINASGRILLDLEQEVSTVVPTTSSGIDSPTIRQRRIRTSVVINNGESLALGGLIQNSTTLARTQLPVIGDIPLIGNAFKNKDNQLNRTELIIVITPHLMRNVNEARRVTDEYRQELQMYDPPPALPTRNPRDAARRALQ